MQVVFVCVYVCDLTLFFFFFFGFTSARPLLLDTARPFRPRPSKRLILPGACHREAIINTRDCTPSVSDRKYHRPVARSHWRKSATKIHARHHHRLQNTNKVMSANNNAPYKCFCRATTLTSSFLGANVRLARLTRCKPGASTDLNNHHRVAHHGCFI